MENEHPKGAAGRLGVWREGAPRRLFKGKSLGSLYLRVAGCLFLWECIVRIAAGWPFLGEGLFFAALFGASLAGPYAAVCGLLPPRAGRAAAIALVAATGALYTMQMFYFFIFNTYATAFSIFNGTQALQFGETIGSHLARVWPWVLCMLAPLAAFIVAAVKLPMRRAPAAALAALLLGAALHLAGLGLLPAFGTGLFTPYDYYHTGQSLNPTAGKLGLYTTLRLDAKRLFAGAAAKIPPPSPVPAQRPASPESRRPAAAGQPPENGKEPPARVLGPNVLNIDLEALAETEEDAAIADLHRYFAAVRPTMQNDYTGLFEGLNLITVTAESFAPYAVDPGLTPTLYKMMHEGMNFTNYTIPLWDTSTLDGEYAICQGLVPKQGVWSMMITGQERHTLPFTLGNQFLARGYQTFAYHNHNAQYYDRAVSHPNMGYTFKALDAGLKLTELGWPESDLEMVDFTADEFIGDGGAPFHVYYLTVSGHQPYETYNAMSQKNWGAVADRTDLTVRARAYLACNIELDRALELLLRRLNEAGIAEKTVITLTSDHPPYGLQLDEMNELAGHPIDYQFEYYRSSFFIYRQGMKPVTVDKPCTSVDILPTLSNLFALPYDSRLLMGRDIFSSTEPLVMLANRSWITDKARFSAFTGVVTPADKENPVDSDYVQRIHQTVAERFAYSARIVETDYYARLFPPTAEKGAP